MLHLKAEVKFDNFESQSLVHAYILVSISTAEPAVRDQDISPQTDLCALSDELHTPYLMQLLRI